ncbi:MAG: transrane protein [Rhodocyclales bacterium]|nr:transrane protein [Rhodocyclales bacterium]
MTRTALRIALIGAFGITYLWMAHQAATVSSPNALVVVTGFMPLAFMLLTWTWNSRARWPALAGVAGLFLLLHLFTQDLIDKIVWVYFIQDLSCNLFACSIFAMSLRPSSEALCTRLARMARSRMTPLVERYTRWITYAWALFFAGCVVLSAGLFLSGHVTAWSWFANVLNLPLIGAMFVIEYLTRLWVIPKAERSGIVETIRSVAAYGQHQTTATTPAGEQR